jgi:hypothetical protein
MIHRVFAEEGLPTDLAMIAMIESAFLTHARSQRVGAWYLAVHAAGPGGSTA